MPGPRPCTFACYAVDRTFEIYGEYNDTGLLNFPCSDTSLIVVSYEGNVENRVCYQESSSFLTVRYERYDLT